MSELKFVVDHNVGRLAKWLRMVGFDTKFFTGENDSDMVEMALAENRIILTRDTRIMERRVVADGRLKAILIESDRLEKQLAQVITVLGLYKSRFRPFTICLEDNEPLIGKTKDEVKDRVSPYVYQTQQQFVECPKCRRIYWRGTHWQAMSRQIEQSAGQS
jgi:uncharacterized protein with PIN domain